jgi:uncharacterized membrane protein
MNTLISNAIKMVRLAAGRNYLQLMCIFIGSVHLNAATETISTGSFIINMGVTPQTISNGIKPYGLLYDLLQNYHVPVKWVINGAKGKDGIDFTYNGVDYKGGTFIIQAEYRSASVNARIAFWQGLGVVGVTTAAPISVPVALTITTPPNWTLDQQNGSIAENYIKNAGIPLTAYSFKDPADLDCCDNVFAMPHADPEWSTHSRLYSWNKDCLGAIWAACHAVSALENLYDPLDTATQMNFLSIKIPKNPKPSPYAENSLLIWTDHNDGSTPYTYSYHTDPIMQFMGTLDDATTNGSEQIYMPVLTGSWRPSTKLAVIDPTQADVPLKSPGPAAVVAYGQGFGDNARGKVMYEAGHNHNGNKPENVAAERAFLNFSFFASLDKAPLVSIISPTDTFKSAHLYNVNATVSSPITSLPYSYMWSTMSCGGSFGDPTAPTTTFTPANVLDTTPCILRLVVVDGCGRTTFMDKMIVIIPGIPKIGLAKKITSGPLDNLNGSFTFTYSIKVKNTGEVTMSSLQVQDNLSTSFSGAGSFSVNSVSSSKFTINPAYNGSSNINLLSGSNALISGDSGTVLLTVTVFPGSNYGVYNNNATVSGISPVGVTKTDISQDGTDVDPDNDGDPTNNNVPTPVSFPRIQLTKTGVLNTNVVLPNGIANTGDKISYSFKVCNTGKTLLTNVIVTDPLLTVTGGPLGSLNIGACDSTTFTGSYTLTQSDVDAGVKNNTATATGKDPINQNISNSDTETTPIPKNASISLVKTGTLNTNVVAPNGVANVGDKIIYSFKVTNTGNVTLTNVTVTDPIVTVSGGPITLAPGATDNVTFTGVYTLTQTDIDAGFKYNTATTTGKDPQNIIVTGVDDETTVIPKLASIALVKTGVLNGNIIAPNGIANPGDKINYAFKVTNTGNVTLTGVTVTDPIVTVSGGPITLAPGASDNVSFTGVYTLTQTDIDAGFKYNTATTTGKDPQNVGITNGDDETTLIPKITGIALVKTGILDLNVIAPNGIANPGDKINYTFKVTNTGNVTLTNITVTDPIVAVSGGPITLAPGATDNITFTGVYTLTQTDIDAGFKYNTATTTGKDPQNINVTSGDDETTVIPKVASIALVKTGILDLNVIAPNGIANPGDKINYTFKVTNTGNVTLTSITVTDPIVTVSGGPITLAPGATDNLTFTGVYTLTQADIDAGFKYNTATTTGKDPQNISVTNGDDETTIIPKSASIAIVKTGVLDMNVIAPNGIANAGDKIHYSFQVTNTGNVTLTNVVVTDPLVSVSGGPITLLPGATDNSSFTAVYTLTQSDINSGFKYNTATTNAKDPQNQNVTNSDDETTTIPKNAGIAIVKTGVLDMNVVAPNGVANVGDKIIYSFKVTNTGNVTLTNVTVTDPIVTVSGGPITLAPGASDNVTFTGVYTLTQTDIDAGFKYNTATTTGKDPQNISVSNGDDETTSIPKVASIALVKTGILDMNVISPNGIANPGDKINYTFKVTNTGNVTLTSVTVTDPIVTVSGGPITLAPGASDNVTFTGVYTLTQTDIDAGFKYNTATTTGKDPQNLNVTNGDDETTLIPKIASIALVKTGVLDMNVIAPNGIANAGDKINYTFKVTNTGNVTLTNVTVTDPIVTVSGGPITLAPGATDNLTFTGVYTLTQTDIDAGFKYNTATTTGKDPQNIIVTNGDDETTIIPKNASIAIVKTGVLDMNVIAPNGIANAGDKIHYSFQVTNTGNVTLTNVVVTDPLVSVSGGPITLLPGATDNSSFTAVYTLTQSDINSGFKYNTATTNAKDPQNQNVTNSDDETTTIPKNAGIAIVKTGVLDMNVVAPNGVANVGDKIIYSFKVTNTGNVTLTNVTVTDPIVTVSGGPITLAPGASDNVTFTGVYTLTQTDIDAGFKYNTATTTGKDPQNISITNGDDETKLIPKIASIALVKTGILDLNAIAPNGIANPGDKINYTFKVTNTGNVTLTNITVADPIVGVSGGPITLAPGATDNITFTGVYTLTQADIDAGFKYNTATTTGKDPQNINVTNGDDETTLIPKNASIALVKTGILDMNAIAPNGIANPGDKINYTFKVTNTGNVTLTNITITDPIVSVSGGPITLVPGASDNISFTGVYTLTQADIDAGFKYNTATTTGKDPQNLTVTNGDDETTLIPTIASIALVKTGALDMNVIAPNGVANVGDKINYSFLVTNTGNVTLTNITVTDPIVTVTGGPITLAPGASNSTTFTGVYTLTQSDIDAGFKYNVATTTGKDPQNISVTNGDDETTSIPKMASIALVKTGVLNMNVIAPNGIANPGDKINYTFKVTNTGNVTLTNITVTDPIVTVNGGPITLAPGASDNVTFTGVYTLTQADIDAGFKYNTATTTGKDPQNISVTNGDDETTSIPKIASIELVKTGILDMNVISPGGIANMGDKIHYSFKVTNTGNVTLSSIAITDPIVTVNGGPITLAPGGFDNTTFTGVYVLTQTDIDAGFKYNTAKTTGKDPQNLTVMSTDDETTVIPKQASISLIKTGVLDVNAVAPNGIANVGDKIHYTFKVTNTGNVSLSNVSVADPIVTVIGGPVSLAPGQMDNTTFTGVYSLTQSDIDAGIKFNMATTIGTDPQNQFVTDNDDETTTIPQSPKIILEKQGVLQDLYGDGYANVGEHINYAFRICNTGNVTLTNVSVTDPLINVSGGPIPVLGVGDCNYQLINGSYAITQMDIDSGRVVNSATVHSSDPKGKPVTDVSDDPNDLSNVDPDKDGDPDDPTITLLPQNPKIGIAKKLISVTNNLNGTFSAQFELRILNTGNVTLGDIQITDNLTDEFGNYNPVSTLNPGEYTFTNFVILGNSTNPLTLNSGFNGKTDQFIFNVSKGGVIKVGEVVTVGIRVIFLPVKYSYMNQAIAYADKPSNDEPVGTSDDDSEDTSDYSDSGINATNDKMQGGANPGEPGDKGTVDDPTQILIPAAKLSGRVWDDLNANGIQDSGENGMMGVEVWLYNCTGSFVKKVSTDVNGKYIFDFLPAPLAYFVLFKPIGYSQDYGFTIQNAGIDDAKDSDVDLSGVGPCISLEINDQNDSYDAGLVRFATTGNFVWNDKNGNGVQDSGEEGLSGVKVTIYNATSHLPVKNTITDVSGNYLFKGLYPGNYYLKFDTPAGWNNSKPNAADDFKDNDVDNSNGPGTTATTYLSAGESDLSWDAAYFICLTISGVVWNDLDKDGIYDLEEKGINGLNVEIVDAITGIVVTKMLTDIQPGTPSKDGYYKSDCLEPGNYYVHFERPGDLGASPPYQGSNPDKDCDITHANGINTTRTIALMAGLSVSGIGGGFQTKSMVGDKVWIDQNFNGIQDLNEKPLSGVKVEAYNYQGVKVSESESGVDGKFMLDGMTQGSYYIKFELPNPNYNFTVSHAGADDLDNDVDGTFGYGTTKLYQINSGEIRPTIDAGVVSQVLDLEWLQFYGNFNGSFTELNWSTAAENENDYFIVERRFETEQNFVQIGKVESLDNPNHVNRDYEFDDFNVRYSGVYYYRIKQVNKNGSFSYSKKILIHVNEESEDVLKISLYPNPTTQFLNVEMKIPMNTELEAKIIDNSGRVLMSVPLNQLKSKGISVELIQISNLNSGQYILEVKTSNDVIHKKFTVLK